MTLSAKTFKIAFPLLLWLGAAGFVAAADPGQYFNPLAGIGLGAREAALEPVRCWWRSPERRWVPS